MSTNFDSLGLAPALVRAVTDEGYTQPTPIQQQAIPIILQGRDILAAAQTGTGKTAGFTLPMLQMLAAQNVKPAPKTVRALILTPTRELAAQVEEAVRTYGKHVKLSSALVYGGVGINPQIDALKRGVDILVATPGRLLDHVGQKTVDLSQVEFLVLDEADRMLDMGFIHDIKRVLKLLPAKKQSLLFSATFSDEIRTLANGLLNNPASVEVARNTDSALVTQVIHPVAKNRKREMLRDLIVDGQWEQVLVFTRMKHGANRLAEQLNKDGITAAAIHGNKSQGARIKALSGFKDKSIRVLVATDIAARGLDIEQLPNVVNYELPNVPEDYVHRIGRTGRAGSPGHAVSLVSPDENEFLRSIERLLKKKLHQVVMPGYEGPPPADMVEEESRPPRPPRNQPRSQPARRPDGGAPRSAAPARGTGGPKPARSGQPPRGNAQAPRQNSRAEHDDDDFGNSIHYKPRTPAQPSGRGPRRGAPTSAASWQPADPFEPTRQTLSVPQSMPGEGRGGAGDGRRDDRRGPSSAAGSGRG
ncbi:MAG: DEAD/DEAH box helicase, partial [Burkholderiaceae bacterium]